MCVPAMTLRSRSQGNTGGFFFYVSSCVSCCVWYTLTEVMSRR